MGRSNRSTGRPQERQSRSLYNIPEELRVKEPPVSKRARNDTRPEVAKPYRRLAAIPLLNDPSEIPAAPEADSSLPMLGAASVGLLCAGYMLRRRCSKLNRDAIRAGSYPIRDAAL